MIIGKKMNMVRRSSVQLLVVYRLNYIIKKFKMKKIKRGDAIRCDVEVYEVDV